MNVFWIIIAVLIVLVLGSMLWPLLRRAEAAPDRAEFDLTVYRDQLGEVDQDLARGVLSPDQADAARTEIQRRMLAAAPDGGSASATGSSERVNGALAVLLAVVVSAGSMAIYLTYGSPSAPDQPLASRQQQIKEATAEDAKMMELIGELAKKMKADPSNVEGWSLLARSYQSIDKFDQAAAAYQQILALSDAPEWRAAYAEVLVMQENGTVTPQAVGLFEKVLSSLPNDPRSYFYIGVAKAQKGDIRGAMETWQTLAAISPAGSPWLPNVRERIVAAAKELGIEGPVAGATLPAMSRPGQSTPGASAPGPTRQDMEAASQMTEGDRSAMIRTMVDRLAARLKDEPGDLQGWVRLERAYRVLGETQKADAAAKRIEALKK